MLRLLRPASDPDYPWTGFLFGIWGGSIWYWCADQEIVQRTLCARNEKHARIGALGAALLKTTPMFFMVVPGVVCKALYPELLAREGTDVAYPILITQVLPPGAVGLVVAAMLSALMSTLASVFNSSSTLFTMDVWRRVRPNASDRQLVHVGRVAVAAMAIISVTPRSHYPPRPPNPCL
jgi:SSS family solute:Na+ symporter